MTTTDYLLCGLGVFVLAVGALIGLLCLLAKAAAEEGENDDIV